MKYWEAVKVAWQALLVNKLRSFLTMLGIIIGVGAVIALLAAGQGVQNYVTGQLQSVGTNLLFVMPGTMEEGPHARATLSNLTYQDAMAIADPYSVPDAVAVSPQMLGAGLVTSGHHSKRFNVSGVMPNYAQVRNSRVIVGRFISQEDTTTKARVAVLGSRVAEDLFGDEYPIGERIQINKLSFEVVGVLERKGGSGFGSEDQQIYVPLTTAESRLFPNSRNARGEPLMSVVYVQVADESLMDRATEEIATVLRERHGIKFQGGEDDFTIVSQADLISVFGDVTRILTIFLGAIAAISLLVGGIGIMNIMLVSVTERTREIGLRKAVGAKKRDILLQFLVEATALSLTGGIIGILLGVAGAKAISSVAGDLAPVVTFQAILLATGFSIAVGLFFGIYPASRAASLNPIDALRYE